MIQLRRKACPAPDGRGQRLPSFTERQDLLDLDLDLDRRAKAD
jgi:hypothetical protein